MLTCESHVTRPDTPDPTPVSSHASSVKPSRHRSSPAPLPPKLPPLPRSRVETGETWTRDRECATARPLRFALRALRVLERASRHGTGRHALHHTPPRKHVPNLHTSASAEKAGRCRPLSAARGSPPIYARTTIDPSQGILQMAGSNTHTRARTYTKAHIERGRAQTRSHPTERGGLSVPFPTAAPSDEGLGEATSTVHGSGSLILLRSVT